MRPEMITFDCYGTLVDWNRGILDALRSEARRHGRDPDDDEILPAYHEAEPRVQGEGYRSYREVLTRLEAELADALGWPPPGEREGYLADSVAGWAPFPDTNPALERLKALGYRLGIVSNVDDDLLAATRAHLTVDFDLLITAEQVESYKPAPAHFERALEAVGRDRVKLLHVAQSWFHDVKPASGLGIRTVWVNRLDEKRPSDGARPAVEVGDLVTAVRWVELRFGSPASEAS